MQLQRSTNHDSRFTFNVSRDKHGGAGDAALAQSGHVITSYSIHYTKLYEGRFDISVRDLVLNIEQYPNLKADKIVLELMKEITGTERQLLAQKADFNNRVTEYNRSIRLMPYALTARFFNFQPRKFVDKENRITSYNVCYTKLLRADRSVNCFFQSTI